MGCDAGEDAGAVGRAVAEARVELARVAQGQEVRATMARPRGSATCRSSSLCGPHSLPRQEQRMGRDAGEDAGGAAEAEATRAELARLADRQEVRATVARPRGSATCRSSSH